MRDFVQSLKTGAPQPYSEARGLLDSPGTSEGFSGEAFVDPSRKFATRFELAKCIHERVPLLRHRNPTRDAGLWAWLALLWFEQLCPSAPDGRLEPREMQRYVPEVDNFQRYYRHLVLGPFLVFSSQGEDGMCMLCQAPHIHPDIAEQLMGRQWIIQARALIGAATQLYYDRSTRKVRTGATTYKGTSARGGVRRMVLVAGQFDRTYDHFACTPESFQQLLPKEFDRYKAGARSS